MKTIMYCVIHECCVEVDEESPYPYYHFMANGEDYALKSECEGLASSPPPELTEYEWKRIFESEPSPEEFELIEQEGLILSQSLMLD